MLFFQLKKSILILPAKIVLTNGTTLKKDREICPRFHTISKQGNRENYFRRLLICYFPWRSNNDLLTSTSYEDKFNENLEMIKPNIERYEPYADITEDAIERQEEIGNDHIWMKDNDSSKNFQIVVYDF